MVDAELKSPSGGLPRTEHGSDRVKGEPVIEEMMVKKARNHALSAH
jgi:hypothetical protein